MLQKTSKNNTDNNKYSIGFNDSKIYCFMFVCVKTDIIAVGTIIANEVPTAKCIIKDLSIPIAPKI